MPKTSDPKRVVVAVDAMGGDYAPGVVLDGADSALARDFGLELLMVGPAEVVEPFCEGRERAYACAASQVIGMGEHPANAVRAKRDSSIVVACKAVRQGKAQGFFSAGSTGACMAAATLFIGRLKGVSRPAIATMLPALKGSGTVLVDCGANADCKPEYLLQFAQMASAYAHTAAGVLEPRVGLLNIGAEKAKGSAFAQEAHALLAAQLPCFAGNAEGNDLLSGRFDVIVTDGFTGNVALKTMEGTAKALVSLLKGAFYANWRTKLAGATVKPGLKKIVSSMSSDSTGAAPLLGVRGVVMIGHGSSSANAITSGIEQTATAIRSDLTGALGCAIST